MVTNTWLLLWSTHGVVAGMQKRLFVCWELMIIFFLAHSSTSTIFCEKISFCISVFDLRSLRENTCESDRTTWNIFWKETEFLTCLLLKTDSNSEWVHPFLHSISFSINSSTVTTTHRHTHTHKRTLWCSLVSGCLMKPIHMLTFTPDQHSQISSLSLSSSHTQSTQNTHTCVYLRSEHGGVNRPDERATSCLQSSDRTASAKRPFESTCSNAAIIHLFMDK